MLEPTERATARCHHDTTYWSRCDLLVGLAELHVTGVEFDHDVGLLTVRVESPPAAIGCAACGVIAHSRGRRGHAGRCAVLRPVATLDPFHGYKNAIDGRLEDATAVLDAFHVVELGTQAVEEVRRRVQQEIHGHPGRKNDPLYGIRRILRCGAEKPTDRQRAGLDRAIAADVSDRGDQGPREDAESVA